MRQNTLRRILICTLLILLGGCVSTGVEDWPDSVPHPQIFVTNWENDLANQQVQSQGEYLQWVKIFYSGNLLYPRGWLDIQLELLKAVESDERRAMEAELEELGIAIGAEWAKLKEDRFVDSRLLALWASILQLAQIDQLELEAVDLIANDVEQLFAGELEREEIVETRYTGALNLESFGDF